MIQTDNMKSLREQFITGKVSPEISDTVVEERINTKQNDILEALADQIIGRSEDNRIVDYIDHNGRPGKYVLHHVTPLDSFERLELLYNVELKEIRRMNHIFGERLIGHITIKIPIKDDQNIDLKNGTFLKPNDDADENNNKNPGFSSVKKPLDPEEQAKILAYQKSLKLKRFLIATRKRSTKGAENEATYYLESAKWNYDEALALFRKDDEWAKAEEKRKLQEIYKTQGIYGYCKFVLKSLKEI